jgi:hypothetical protein
MIRDRVVQGALKLILEPVFEADFQPGSFGYRPKRTAHLSPILSAVVLTTMVAVGGDAALANVETAKKANTTSAASLMLPIMRPDT